MRQAHVPVGAAIAVPILTSDAAGVAAIVQADPANTVPIFLGDARVVPAGVGLLPDQTQAVFLEAGQDLYGIATVAGQVLHVLSAPGLSHFGPSGKTLVEGLGAAGAPSGGVVTVQGPNARGTTPTGYPVLLGVIDSATGNMGTLEVINVNAVPDGDTNFLVMNVRPILFNGSGWDRPRTPVVFKNLSAVVISAETTIWTPAAGKKFRLMGYAIAQGVAAGAITLKDNTAGATILVIPQHTIGVAQISPPMGNGILSAAANNVLTATGIATETITGYVFGTEE